jgi:hypothetical protein
MSRKIALLLVLFIASCFSAVADEQFPNSDIQWILEQYRVSEPVSLIPAEGLDGWTTQNGRKIPNQSRWSNRGGKIVFDRSERGGIFSRGSIITAKQYTNFVLDFAWVATKGCNSGIKYRFKNFAENEGGNHWLGCEYQILDDFNRNEGAREDGQWSAASLYNLFAPDKEKKRLNPYEQINTGRIVVLDNHIEHWLNGQKVLECEVGSDAWKKAVEQSKFSEEEAKVEGFGENPTGFIMLQDHGNTITFAKIVIREIGKKKN